VFIKRDVALYCSSIISSPANTAIVLGVLRFNALLLKSFAGNLIATPASREALLASAAAVVTIIGLVMIAEEVCTILKPSAMKIFERYFNGHERSPDRPAQQGGVA
jgi:hypothetical protein